MATTAELEAAFNQFQSDTKAVEDLTASEKREFIESIFPSGVWIDANDPNLKVGDKIAGSKAGINSGDDFQGYVLTAPPTQDSHIDFIIRY